MLAAWLVLSREGVTKQEGSWSDLRTPAYAARPDKAGSVSVYNAYKFIFGLQSSFPKLFLELIPNLYIGIQFRGVS